MGWIANTIAFYAEKILIEMFLKLFCFDKRRMRLHPSWDDFPVSIPIPLLTNIYFWIPFKRRMSSKTLQLWVVIEKMFGVLTKYRPLETDLLLTNFDIHLTQRSKKVGDSLFFVCSTRTEMSWVKINDWQWSQTIKISGCEKFWVSQWLQAANLTAERIDYCIRSTWKACMSYWDSVIQAVSLFNQKVHSWLGQGNY
jgi:hypothetical protein